MTNSRNVADLRRLQEDQATAPSADATPSSTGGLTEASLAMLLGIHLAEVEARLDAWGIEIRRMIEASGHRLPEAGGVPATAAAAMVQASALAMPPPPFPGIAAEPAAAKPSTLLAAAAPVTSAPHFVVSDEAPKGFHHWAAASIAAWDVQGGRVEKKDPALLTVAAPGTLRAQSEEFDVEADVFYALTFMGKIAIGTRELRIFVHDPAVGVDVVCRVVHGRSGDLLKNRIEFRSLHRSGRLRLRIEVSGAKPGDSVELKDIYLVRLGATADLVARQPAETASALPAASMATVVGREEMMLDAVSGLLRQASKVRVYLNGHTDAPALLDHPRVELAWSRDHTDLGDTGKFFWAEDPAPGPRIVADDDFIFPVDFTEHLQRRLIAYGRQAVVGVHGIILRQPLKDYYADPSRYVHRYVIGAERDILCHTLGTGAICYDPETLKLTRKQFKFNNMADIWLMTEAMQQRVPVIAVSRPYNWLIDNRASRPVESIYVASRSSSSSAFNSAKMQSHVTRTHAPISVVPRMLSGAAIPKVAVVFDGTASLDAAMAEFEAWFRSRDQGYDWFLVFVLATQEQEKALAELISKRWVPHEVHVVGPAALKRPGSLVDALELLDRIAHSTGFMAMPGVRLNRSGWAELVMQGQAAADEFLLLQDGQGRLLGFGWGARGVKAALGSLPETAAARQLGLLQIADLVLGRNAAAMRDLPPASFEAPVRLPVPTAVRLPHARPQPATSVAPARCLTINDVFPHVMLLNLDRRPDRLAMFTRQAERVGLQFERFSAVDGSAEPTLSEWQAYAATPLMPFPAGTQPFRWEYDFYNTYLSDNHRIAHWEHRDGKKTIGRGGWGYQKSMIAILTRAIEEDWESLLVFDDDCLFHKDLATEFDRIMRQVPEDWMLLSLGACQYAWEDKWIRWHNESLYNCMGSSAASHAVAIRRSAFPALMASAQRMDLPFDIGALHTVKRTFWDKCFVFYPNLFIQDVSDTDIGESGVQLSEGGKIGNKYRWDLMKYGN
ncbi:glycosyltransferase family 25 protein [Falsiroseomonas sp. E2-1-a20]|uniref:glycosyltransferase family 25 protein n=1 Tax=Falsiroseomonas sp. E2-1-a20 TaxID=3239300 RepID=UPI003F3CE471